MYLFRQRDRDRILVFVTWSFSFFLSIFAYFGEGHELPKPLLIFYAILVFPPMAHAITRLFSRHTDFLIDERGITERLHMLQIGFLPWSQIKSVQVLVRDINIILAVEPYDRIEVVSQLTFIHRIFLTWNFKHFKSYLLITLPPKKKGVDPDAIRDALRQHGKYIS